jgi:hypothetical protein
MYHRNSRQHKLPDSIAVAENRITGDVGGGTGAIPFPRPDPKRRRNKVLVVVSKVTELIKKTVSFHYPINVVF